MDQQAEGNQEDMIEEESNSDLLDLMIQKKPLQVKLGKHYTLDEYTDLKLAIENREGIQLKSFKKANYLTIRCQGSQPQQEKFQQEISEIQFQESQKCCSFKLIFRIEMTDFFQSLLEQFVKYQVKEEESLILSNKKFVLEQMNLDHSLPCKTFDSSFIFERNKKFMEENKQFLHRIIKKRYDSCGIPETPKNYQKHMKSFFGYDIVTHGFDQIGLKDRKIQTLKTKFQNLVGQARERQKIPVKMIRFRSKRKIRFGHPIKNTKNEEKLRKLEQNQQQNVFQDDSSSKEIDDMDEDGEFRVSLRQQSKSNDKQLIKVWEFRQKK